MAEAEQGIDLHNINNEEVEPQSKRQKCDSSASNSTSIYDPPMHLFKVIRGIPDWANEGFLGAKLANLIPPGIKYILISNFWIDIPFLLRHVPAIVSAKKLLVIYGTGTLEDFLRHAGLMEPSDRTVIHRPPSTDSKHSINHSKVFIVQYDRGLRVIIHTANILKHECLRRTQALFYQDFPRKDTLSPQTEFENDLLAYISKLSLLSQSATHLVSLIKQHDFSAARAKLVASVPGKHTGKDINSWGHLRLKSCLNKVPGGFPAEFINAPIIAQCYSLGSLSADWLRQFRLSCSAGHSGGKKLGSPAGDPLRSGEMLQIIWPAEDQVRDSLEGWTSGMVATSNNVRKEVMWDFYLRWSAEVVGRERVMPHIKTFCRYNENSKHIAWMLVTSHNLSKAAWGYPNDGANEMWIHELGALLLPHLEVAYLNHRWRGFDCTLATSGSSSEETQPSTSLQLPSVTSVTFFQWQQGQSQRTQILPDGTARVPLPVPYTLPPSRYNRNPDLPCNMRHAPWCVDGDHQGFDSLGRTWRESQEPQSVAVVEDGDDARDVESFMALQRALLEEVKNLT